MLAYQYTFLNRRYLPEPPGMALGLIPASWGGGLAVSAVGLSSAYRSGTPLAYCSGTPFTRRSRTPLACFSRTPFTCCSGTIIACCWGTPSFSFYCSSMRVLRGGAFVLDGGATRTSSSSDHSDIVVLHV